MEIEDILDFFQPGAMWLILLVILGFTGIVGAALSYHWKQYSVDSGKASKMFKVYLLVSGILLAIMVISLLLATNG